MEKRRKKKGKEVRPFSLLGTDSFFSFLRKGRRGGKEGRWSRRAAKKGAAALFF